MKNLAKSPGSLVLWVGLLLLTVFSGGCVTTDPGASGGIAQGEVDINRLRAGDAISVVFSGVSNPPDRFDGRIKEDGYIELPMIGKVKAEGKLVGELQAEIHEAYLKYFNYLTVNVNSENRYYSVAGEVRNQSRQVWAGTTTVLSAIASAGGFTDYASKRNVLIIRANGGRLTVNCVKALKNPALDIPIYPYDRIIVKRRWM